MICVVFQTEQENTLEQTTANYLQRHGDISEKQSSDCAAGKHYGHVLAGNLMYKNSPALHGESEDRNGKSFENNYCAKMEGYLDKPFKPNDAIETPCNQKHVKSSHTPENPFKCVECDYSTAQAGNLIKHVQAEHNFEKPFNGNNCHEDMANTNGEKSALLTHVNDTEFWDGWECQWPETHNYTLRNRNKSSRLTKFKSLNDVKNFVVKFSEINNVNFTISSNSKCRNGSIYRKYRCHHGAHTKSIKVTNTG